MLLVNAFSGQINEPMKITIPYATQTYQVKIRAKRQNTKNK